MKRHLAIAGKGGTGKTTFAALLMHSLIAAQKGTILAVDADPNSNLNEVLGVKVETYLSDLLEDIKNPQKIPEGMSKDTYMQYNMAQALVENKHFDFLSMGHPQGPGCYCYPNDLLRKHLETLSMNYDYMLVDCEAGLEHISRRIIQDVTDLFVISDATVRGLRSATRVRELVTELKLPVFRLYLIVTKITSDLAPLEEEIRRTGLPFTGTIPYDEQIVNYDIYGKSLLDLPANAAALQAANTILARCQL